MTTTTVTPETLTLPELAAYMGISVRTLHRRRTQTQAPHGTRMGRRLRFTRADVEAWAGPHLRTQPRADGLTGRLLTTTLAPGSAEWMAYMTASKIAAVMRLSPYESRVSLWLRMAGLAPQVVQSEEMHRGHLLEPAIAAWFAERHPEYVVTETGTWVSATHDWAAASPDRLLTAADGATALLQIKTAGDDYEWGRGLDEIPIPYLCQVQWEMLVTGARSCYVAVLLPRLEFREYLIERNVAECAALVRAGRAFLDSLTSGERPDLDSDKSTYEAIRSMHPDIDDTDEPLDDELAERYLTARAALKAADAEARGAATAVLDAMGRARHALRSDGTKVASRQPNGTHLPKLVANPKAVATAPATATTRSAA